jgi:hypothetical protein
MEYDPLENISQNQYINMTQKDFNSFVDDIEKDVYDDDYEAELSELGIKPNYRKYTRKMKALVKQKHSQVCALSSMKMNGMGKSSLAYWCARDLDKNFSFDRNFFFRGNMDKIKEMTDNLNIGNGLVMDEMVRIWYKRRAMTKGVIDLNEWMGADHRKTGVVLLTCIPDFWDLDSYAREGKIDEYWEILERGIAIRLTADRFPMVNPWHPDKLKEIHHRRAISGKNKKETVIRKVELMERHPCYSGPVFWTKMPKEDELIYLNAVKESAKEENIKDMENEIDKTIKEIEAKHKKAHEKSWNAIVRLSNLLQLRGLTQNAILREAGLDINTFNKMKKMISKKESS